MSSFEDSGRVRDENGSVEFRFNANKRAGLAVDTITNESLDLRFKSTRRCAISPSSTYARAMMARPHHACREHLSELLSGGVLGSGVPNLTSHPQPASSRPRWQRRDEEKT